MILYKDESYSIISACLEVHKTLGSGFLEAVYQKALEIEFAERNISFKAEQPINITYKGYVLNKDYFADFICYDSIIIETKAVSKIIGAHKAQLLNYLKGTGLKLGIIVNFGEQSLKWERITNI